MQVHSYHLLRHAKNDSIYNESGMHLSKISSFKSVALIIWLHHAGVVPMTSCSSNGNCLGIFPGFCNLRIELRKLYYPFDKHTTLATVESVSKRYSRLHKHL